jgi:16S rRNA (guanine(966)-N(2))-methyltransferase RsmD
VAVPNRIRIIGGRHRGRPIPVHAAAQLRPTPDRVRETLFNWLGQDLTGAATLDLFAGTGALTLEALSRGAALAVAVDRNPALIRAIESCARAFGETGLETHVDDALRYARGERRRFDVMFLDPPFADDAWDALLALVAPLVAQGGFVYAEAARALAAPTPFEVLRHGRAGSVHYHLLALASRGGNPR